MDVREHVESNAREFIDALKQWLVIPSTSADPARHGDVRRSADQDPADVGAAFEEHVQANTPEATACLWAELASIGSEFK